MDSEKYHEIYVQADGQFRKAISESDMTEFLKAVHTKLGKVVQPEPAGFMVNHDLTAGTSVRLSYNTTFEAGKGLEEFVWHISAGKAFLVRYNVSSRDLVIK